MKARAKSRKTRAVRPAPLRQVMPAVKRPWENWIRSRADELAVGQGCVFDVAAASRVREFFRKFLRQSKGQWAGQPFELLPWQYDDVIGPLFGWKRGDGLRRYRNTYIELPKKN